MKVKTKKFPTKKVLIVAVILIIVAALVVHSLVFGRGRMPQEETALAVRSSTVETGSISTVISGSGTLANADAEKVTVPEAVEVESVLVDAGDQVTEGDTLATVDRTSVLAALTDAQETLDELDEKLEDTEDDTPPSSITVGVEGRVKKIYAEEGDSVASLVSEHGGLLLLSLDGKMAVTLPVSEKVSLGDEVQVTRANGDTTEGEVAGVASDSMVVTLTDNGPAYGEEVSVAAEDGTELGSGTLYIHSALAVTGYTGTISSVQVSENQKVSSGTTLVKLTDLGHTAEYDSLLAQRTEQADELQTLTKLYQNNVIIAPFTGTVQTVEVETDTVSSGSSSSGSNYSPVSANTTTGQGSVVLLNASIQPAASSEDSSAEEDEDGGDDSGDSSAGGDTSGDGSDSNPGDSNSGGADSSGDGSAGGDDSSEDSSPRCPPAAGKLAGEASNLAPALGARPALAAPREGCRSLLTAARIPPAPVPATQKRPPSSPFPLTIT